MKTKKYFIDADKRKDVDVFKALEFACKQSETKKIIILTENTKNQTYQNIDDILRNFKYKRKGNIVEINNCNKTILILSKRTHLDIKVNVTVITFFIKDEDIFNLNNYKNIKEIIAIPTFNKDIKLWLGTYGSYELISNKKYEKFEKPESIIKNAFNSLSNKINLGYSILNSNDTELLKTYVRSLYKHNNDLNSNSIFAFLINELNWKTKTAYEVKKLFDTLINGKYFKGGEKKYLHKYIKEWKK